MGRILNTQWRADFAAARGVKSQGDSRPARLATGLSRPRKNTTRKFIRASRDSLRYRLDVYFRSVVNERARELRCHKSRSFLLITMRRAVGGSRDRDGEKMKSTARRETAHAPLSRWPFVLSRCRNWYAPASPKSTFSSCRFFLLSFPPTRCLRRRNPLPLWTVLWTSFLTYVIRSMRDPCRPRGGSWLSGWRRFWIRRDRWSWHANAVSRKNSARIWTVIGTGILSQGEKSLAVN